jgi:hypothetical protein
MRQPIKIPLTKHQNIFKLLILIVLNIMRDTTKCCFAEEKLKINHVFHV